MSNPEGRDVKGGEVPIILFDWESGKNYNFLLCGEKI